MSLVTTSGARISASGGADATTTTPHTANSSSSFASLTTLSDSLPLIDAANPSTVSSFNSSPSTSDSADVASPAASPLLSPAASSTALASSTASSSSASSSPFTPSSSSSSGSLDGLSLESIIASLPGPTDNDDDLSWELGLGSLIDEIASIDSQRHAELHAALQQRVAQHKAQVAADRTGLTPLPHADSYSSTFHRVVMEQYDRLGNLGLTPKQVFVSRKLKAKQSRAAKRAEEVFDKQSHKLQQGRHKAKSRQKARY